MSYEPFHSESFVTSEPNDGAFISKREDERQRVLLTAQLHVIDCQGDVHVTDLSRSGMRGTTNIALEVGVKVFVSLDDITHCSGTVRWTQDRRFGLKFCRLLDMIPIGLSNDFGLVPDHRERMPRITTNLNATISLCRWTSKARIRNVSKSGMMVETELPLTANQQLLVNLSDGKILTADARWVEGNRVGVRLSNPVSILQFTHGRLR